MNDWLENARRLLAESVGDDGAVYDLSQEDIDNLLDLARVAAHDSGERISAPLLTYLAGLARGRHPERSLSELIVAVGGKEL